MCPKLIPLLMLAARLALAIGMITLVPMGPAAALDRLLMLGGIPLRDWLTNTCNEVDNMNELDQLEARKQRILRLQAEAETQVEVKADWWVRAVDLWGKAPENRRAEAKEILDKAEQELMAAKNVQWNLNEQVPVLLRCIEYRKVKLTPEPPPSGGGGNGGGVVSAGCGGGRELVLTTSVNTPCSLNLGALFGAIFGVPPSDAVSDMRLESQPSHGSAIWSNGTLTYTPAPDYRGADSFTMSSARKALVDGQLVDAGRETQVWKITVE